MKEKNKIPLSVLRDRLQARMHYDHPDKVFQDLLICFGHYEKHKTGWAGYIRRQGYLSVYLAHKFALYVGYPIDKS